MSRFRRPLVALALALLTSRAVPALGDSPTSAEALLAQGLALRETGRDEEALALFRRSLDLNQAGRTLAQIGLAEQALGRYVAAEHDLRTALAKDDDPWIQANGDALSHALAFVVNHLANVEVVTTVPGAELWVNGVRAGMLPLPPIRTQGGDLVLELRAPGYEPLRRHIEVTAGERFREEMLPVPSPQLPAPPAPPAPVERPPVERAPKDSTRGVVAWSLLGAGGAFLAAGIAAQLLREADVQTYNDDSLCFFGSLTRDERCGRYRGAANTAQTLAIAGYVGAGAAVGASTILFLLDRKDAHGTAGLWCRPALLSIACGQSF
jgi:tetratricopeptide (TPR) repeat protein